MPGSEKINQKKNVRILSVNLIDRIDAALPSGWRDVTSQRNDSRPDNGRCCQVKARAAQQVGIEGSVFDSRTRCMNLETGCLHTYKMFDAQFESSGHWSDFSYQAPVRVQTEPGRVSVITSRNSPHPR